MIAGAYGRARVYAAAAAGCTAFAVWGSLLPFDFHRVPLDAAFAAFVSGWNASIASWSLTDLVSNVMLFAPIGFFLAAALGDVDWRPPKPLVVSLSNHEQHARPSTSSGRAKFGRTAAALAAGLVLSVAIEIGQAFVSWRIPSLVDVIAESFGTACGVAAWRIVGGEIDVMLESALDTIRRSSRAERWLIVYTAAFALFWLLPGDFTLRPAEIGDKYFHERLLPPFTPSPDAAAPADLALLFVAAIPLGVAAAVAGCRPHTLVLRLSKDEASARVSTANSGLRERRSIPKAAAIAAAALVLLESAQVLVFSRTTDATALLVVFIGTVVGMCSAALAWRSNVSTLDASVVRVAITTVVSIAVLVVLEWWPFDGFLDAHAVRLQMTSWSLAPFRAPAHAFDLVPGAMFAAAAGAFFWNRLSTHYPRVQALLIVGAGAVLFVAIEAGRLLLPGPRPTLVSVLVKLLVLAGSLTAVKFGGATVTR